MANEKKMKRYTVDLDHALHRRARLYALHHEVNLSDVVRGLLESLLEGLGSPTPEVLEVAYRRGHSAGYRAAQGQPTAAQSVPGRLPTSPGAPMPSDAPQREPRTLHELLEFADSLPTDLGHA